MIPLARQTSNRFALSLAAAGPIHARFRKLAVHPKEMRVRSRLLRAPTPTVFLKFGFWSLKFSLSCYHAGVKNKIVLPLVLMAVFALSRWPGVMPQNFSAAYAIVFCAGLYVPGRPGWIVPLATLAASDVLISFFFYRTADFSWVQFALGQAPNYLAYAALIGMGRAFGTRRPWWLLVGGGILGAILFYLVTNTAAWLNLPYAKSFAGWVHALTIGMPGFPQTWEFFRNTLLSGGLFTGLFVGAMKLTAPSEAPEEEPSETESEPQPQPEKAECKMQSAKCTPTDN
jgi:hypothetical protein